MNRLLAHVSAGLTLAFLKWRSRKDKAADKPKHCRTRGFILFPGRPPQIPGGITASPSYTSATTTAPVLAAAPAVPVARPFRRRWKTLPHCSTELHPTPQAKRHYGEHQQHSCHSQCWEEPMKDSVRNTRFTLLSTGIVLRSALQTHEAAVAETASRGEALTLGLGGNAPALWR